MRSLRRNMTSLWLVTPTDYVPVTDLDGFKTGEYEYQYSTPVKISMTLNAFDGAITFQPFGKTELYDMYAVTTKYDLDKDSLLYYDEPTSDFDTTYDFKVDKKLKSLNSITYGLKVRA